MKQSKSTIYVDIRKKRRKELLKNIKKTEIISSRNGSVFGIKKSIYHGKAAIDYLDCLRETPLKKRMRF